MELSESLQHGCEVWWFECADEMEAVCYLEIHNYFDWQFNISECL